MAQLRQDYERFVERGAEILVVGPEDAAAFEAYWQRESLPYVGLPDPGREVIDRYGQQFKILRLGRLPAGFLIDREGVVRHAHYGNSMRDIVSNRVILDLLDAL